MTTDFAGGDGFVQGRLPNRLVESMLLRLLASPVLFNDAKTILTPAYFSAPGEAGLAAVWQAALRVKDMSGELSYAQLLDATEEVVGNDVDGLLENEHSSVFSDDPDSPGIIFWLFHGLNSAALETEINYSRHLLRRFLQERAVADKLRYAFDYDGVPSDLQTILKPHVELLNRIDTIEINPIERGIPDVWDYKPLDIRATGLPFFDRFMNGGHAPNEAYGVLGPFGSGKTTLMVQLCVSVAEQELLRSAETGKPPRAVYFVTYEQSAPEIRAKAISCAANINSRTTETMRSPEQDFSRRGQYKEYENAEFFDKRGENINSDPPPPGEYERYLDVKHMLREQFRIVDFTGAKSMRLGQGYVDEIAAYIENDHHETGAEAAVIIVDHVWLACWRHQDDENKLRHYITMFGDEAKRKLSQRFNAPVWLLHQLSGEANTKKVGTLLDHAQAAESRSFGMPLTFCFCLSKKDENTNCLRINCSKRRRAGDRQAPSILLLDGAFNRMLVADDTHQYMKRTNEIVLNSVADRVNGPADVEDTADYGDLRNLLSVDGAGNYGTDN